MRTHSRCTEARHWVAGNVRGQNGLWMDDLGAGSVFYHTGGSRGGILCYACCISDSGRAGSRPAWRPDGTLLLVADS